MQESLEESSEMDTYLISKEYLDEVAKEEAVGNCEIDATLEKAFRLAHRKLDVLMYASMLLLIMCIITSVYSILLSSAAVFWLSVLMFMLVYVVGRRKVRAITEGFKSRVAEIEG